MVPELLQLELLQLELLQLELGPLEFLLLELVLAMLKELVFVLYKLTIAFRGHFANLGNFFPFYGVAILLANKLLQLKEVLLGVIQEALSELKGPVLTIFSDRHSPCLDHSQFQAFERLGPQKPPLVHLKKNFLGVAPFAQMLVKPKHQSRSK